MSDFFVDVEGLESVMWRIRSLPDEAKDQVLTDVSEHALEVIRDEPPQNSITRRQAYGRPFFSDRQRKYFFAALASGEIQVPYRRTGTLSKNWSARREGDKVVFGNTTPYAPFVMGFAAQSRHEKLVGWKKITDILNGKLSFRSSTFRSVVMAAVQKAIRKLQLG